MGKLPKFREAIAALFFCVLTNDSIWAIKGLHFLQTKDKTMEQLVKESNPTRKQVLISEIKSYDQRINSYANRIVLYHLQTPMIRWLNSRYQ